ncbi:hypothetical protein [Phyllobacterium meliloti]|uniref:hypothetical protein n=1 Tax=Phyllobacterium meliloti TaxID=555317 RepID=UPI001D13AB81|nr:hypothetical protein [Phyllobacterium sp. T1293]UGX87414.1 hypothetical protein LLE53_006160 [Phyllobacterium sp. T1293]
MADRLFRHIYPNWSEAFISIRIAASTGSAALMHILQMIDDTLRSSPRRIRLNAIPKGRRWRWMKVSATDEASPGQEPAFGNSFFQFPRMAVNSLIHRQKIEELALQQRSTGARLNRTWRRTVRIADYGYRISVLKCAMTFLTIGPGSV